MVVNFARKKEINSQNFLKDGKPYTNSERAMKNQTPREYCLIVEGNYFDECEAEQALRDSFIEE